MTDVMEIRHDEGTEEERNKAICRAGIEAVLNAGDPTARLSEFFVDDVLVHTTHEPEPLRGIAAFAHLQRMIHSAFPDIHYELQDMVAEGDKVVERFVMTGTHTGEYFGFPPTGRRFCIAELIVLRFEEGKAVEVWPLPDLLGQMQQIGMVPSGPPPKGMLLVMGLMSRLAARRRRR